MRPGVGPTKVGVILAILAILAVFVTTPAGAEPAGTVPAEEYEIFDRVIEAKFLTSQTSLVLVNRLTVTSLVPEQPVISRSFLKSEEVFLGTLPADLVTDFVLKNANQWRLDSRFHLGVRVRFVRNGEVEQDEVGFLRIPVRHSNGLGGMDVPTTVGVLQLSRAAFSQTLNEALVYVGQEREDGTGGGYLVWLKKDGDGWTISDTEVLWVAKITGPMNE